MVVMLRNKILLSFRDSNRTIHGWNDRKSAAFFKVMSLGMNGSQSGYSQTKKEHDNKLLKLGAGDLGARYAILLIFIHAETFQNKDI